MNPEIKDYLNAAAVDNGDAVDHISDYIASSDLALANVTRMLEEEAYHRQSEQGLLRIALAYVEAYAGRFPDNVRPEHLKRFRAWRSKDQE